MNRLSSVRSHMASAHAADGRRNTSEDGVVICCAVRTPITKAGKGGLRHALPEDMLVTLFNAIYQKTKIDPKCIQDVCVGNALQAGAGQLSSRIAQLLSDGGDTTTGVYTVNRQCSSGLQAVANVAAAIQSGVIDIGIAGGVESMTHFDMVSTVNPEKISEKVFTHDTARDCLLPMGLTSENVVKDYGLKRETLDAFSCESHARATKAQQSGLFDLEIVPVKVKDPNTGETITVSKDDGIRPNTTMKALSSLKPAFAADGVTTAGNSSQVSDGASLVLLCRESMVKKFGLQPLLRFKSFAVTGVPPRTMGIGPMYAIPKAVQKAGLKLDDIGVFELNEAFASQCSLCVSHLKLPMEKVNPYGGAIALGHPLGCTGARLICTMLTFMNRQNVKFGCVSMCVGTGMGAAAVFENMSYR